MTRLVLIRHGQANAYVDQVVGGPRGCTGLTEHGRAQARALRDRLLATGDVAGAAFVCSELPRAIETAAIIQPAVRDDAATQHCDLCELHPGECDGAPFGEWSREHGFDLVAEPDRPLSPGGESLRSFDRRVHAAVDRLLQEHAGETVVVVTHGGFIASSTRRLMAVPLPEPGSFTFGVDNTSITEWRIDGDRTVLVRIGDAAHLEGLPPAPQPRVGGG